MGFFDRNRKALEERGIDPARLPPGQYHTERFPVLHVGSVPSYTDVTDPEQWNLLIGGLVEEPVVLTWNDLMALPSVEVTVDVHCVTKWSKFDMVWKGVAFETVLDLVTLKPEATHLMQHDEQGYTTNLPLADCLGVDDKGQPRALFAYEHDGVPLEPEHGYPLRFFLPRLYFWKSTKWLRGIEFMAADRPGFWEQNGYHIYGDPFLEQRYTND